MEQFRGGLVLKAHEFVYHFTLGSRVIKKEEEKAEEAEAQAEVFIADALPYTLHYEPETRNRKTLSRI